ncbi:unnamed protein product [Urochloa humidicola]
MLWVEIPPWPSPGQHHQRQRQCQTIPPHGRGVPQIAVPLEPSTSHSLVVRQGGGLPPSTVGIVLGFTCMACFWKKDYNASKF